MKEKSIWLENVTNRDFSKLDKDIKCGVLIIGGGIVGILAAYELEKRKIDYVLVEQNKIGYGTSKDTTAFITAQHETLYQDLIRYKGKKAAKEYLDLNLKAIDKYKELSKVYDFDFKECDSCLFSTRSKEVILREKEALDKLDYKTEIIDKLPLDLKIKAGIKFKNQATINPYKLITKLSSSLNIYENTKIRKIRGHKAITVDGKIISFDKVIIATHYPIANVRGLYFTKLTQTRSYVVACKNEDIKDTFCSIDENGLYFRSYKDYLIIGGDDRETKYRCKNEFYKQIKYLYKDIEIEYRWSGEDCSSLDGIPYIGRFSLFKKDYYLASGFNLWGFTWAMASSFILADLIENKNNYRVCNPLRNFINKNWFINVGNAIKNLLAFRKPRCKHLGCALNYNKYEKVYECPCHGSRYDKEGNILDGPTLKKLYKREKSA